MARGAVLTVDQTWALAKIWYRDRLDPAWRRLSPPEATAAFAALGLSGDFWSLT